MLKGKTTELLNALELAAHQVRGMPSYLQDPEVLGAVAAIEAMLEQAAAETTIDPSQPLPVHAVDLILKNLGVDAQNGELPQNLSALLAVAQLLPATVSQRLLTEILALIVTPSQNS